MRIIKFLMVIAMLMLYSTSIIAQSSNDSDAEAQELGYHPHPYGFVQLQGGVGTTFTDISCFKLLTPTFSIAAGYMFSPAVGARFHVNGYRSKGGFDIMGQYYEGLTASEPSGGVWKLIGDPMKYNFNYANANIDLMVNIFNLTSNKHHHPLDLYFIGGYGLNYIWNNDDLERITSQYNVGNNISKPQTRSSINLHLGLLADYNLSKNWSLGVEVDFNSLDDSFNSKASNIRDWMVTAQVSLTYKFGFKKATKPAPEAVSATPLYQDTRQSEVASAPTPKPFADELIKEVKENFEPIKEHIFYAIRESDLENEDIINKVVAWCKKYPNKTITIDGYADKGTGTPKVNETYAKLRAEKVAVALQAKGISVNQIIVNAHGDSIQPFEDNDKNRCVIIEGK